MLLRLRGPEGMVKITIDKNETFADLGHQVSLNLSHSTLQLRY
jgi:hypothetical protein